MNHMGICETIPDGGVVRLQDREYWMGSLRSTTQASLAGTVIGREGIVDERRAGHAGSYMLM